MQGKEEKIPFSFSFFPFSLTCLNILLKIATSYGNIVKGYCHTPLTGMGFITLNSKSFFVHWLKPVVFVAQ
jgi:hypothetical protein